MVGSENGQKRRELRDIKGRFDTTWHLMRKGERSEMSLGVLSLGGWENWEQKSKRIVWGEWGGSNCIQGASYHPGSDVQNAVGRTALF